ncbi:hypothetical protein IDJ77_22900 [Mucilaginibacter sp. ZT4R22]|uniref:GLPGLI family protein n=1 Tax=Mucilaginibacter pankratovii TaxID=2772110 RepID=A0ABR7WZ08_9SPHI|nr:hypothetical protein [Mucilaginibacter pankratovii]MBD1366679.1 hypothetical protein [Mucilaginibacter pankratovii]
MAGVNSMLARQNMQFQMQMQMNMNMMRGFYNDSRANIKYTFKVTLKDSTSREVKSIIYLDTVLHKNYLVFENKDLPKKDSLRKQKIYADQTANISRKGFGASYEPYTMVGIANDSCWLFRAIKGNSINVYSFLSESEDGLLDESTLAAIQQNNGPIVKLNEENLKAMLADDPDALKYIKDKKYLKAIKTYNKNFAKLKKAQPPATAN